MYQGWLICLAAFLCTASGAAATLSPYQLQTAEQLERLASAEAAHDRAAAAEALGYLRNYSAADALAKAREDRSAIVRREAAMALGFCGGRDHVQTLAENLEDSDWTVRQSAWVALTNLTGMEWPFDALAEPEVRSGQARRWRQWVAEMPADGMPREVLDLIAPAARISIDNLALAAKVVVSSIYKGPPEALTDGSFGPLFWQTKNVKFPQHCTIDMGKLKQIGCIVVQQYGPGFCMTDYKVETSIDGKTFEQVARSKKKTPPRLIVKFPVREARFVRITSFATERALYPTTFREVEAYLSAPPEGPDNEEIYYQAERGMRAIGALGGSPEQIVGILKPYVQAAGSHWAEKRMVQAGIVALGRLAGAEAQELLISLLANPEWARYAAPALGEIGGDDAARALIEAYPPYGRPITGGIPQQSPPDDRPGLEPADRMYETPYAIARALAQMSWQQRETTQALAGIAHLLLANLPSDYDAGMIYEPEAHEQITAFLLDRCYLRRQALRVAFSSLGVKTEGPGSDFDKTITPAARRMQGGIPEAAHWLPALCREREDVPHLIELLEHNNGWVRINAAKALGFINAREAVRPMARLLSKSKTEAEFGYNGKWFFTQDKHQGQSEYNDPPPRWRQAFTRVLGILNAREHTPLLVRLLWDDRNVLEVQMAAAQSLDQLNTPQTLEELARVEREHPFYSVRLFAREALWRRGVLKDRTPKPVKASPQAVAPISPPRHPGGIIFIQGSNNMPNDFQIDHWRQTYSTTDSGPSYRPGRNIMLLESNGKLRPLTRFKDGYVADCEVSWDADRIIFCRRGGLADPWWHIYEMRSDGTGLRQITSGPYHHVQPCYLGDGRIVFSTSRQGIRDEYHGYYGTGLAVMQPDGSDIRHIGFNLGRDDEPAVLEDGRIVFGRLELFYSRLKTERTVHAVFPDGTHDVTLYGPERRALWRQVTVKSKEGWWGEVAPRHRVLRLTQPQPFEPGRIVCASTGGLILTGPGRYLETFIPHPKDIAVTSPYPLADGRILCAAGKRTFKREEADLGLYYLDPKTGEMELLYNDPDFAEFEPRPLTPRPRPPVLIESLEASGNSFTARFACQSVRNSQEARVARRGKLARVVEGLPAVARHHSHLSSDGPAWKNHAGTHARVLGTVPLAADGSFYVEVPADRLIHVQVLDSDRRVVGNQQIWMYARPAEKRSCVGCHERPDTTAVTSINRFPKAQMVEPLQCLPTGGEFSYRAKFWNKGTLPDEGEERTRTVRAVNLIASQ
ncbi:MAG: HEAT repeat domain-containing protein [Planctomycetota bacterium]|jgi:HEAT repeat protein